ncbi:MAG TPA: class I SAM-dependent methyltransferase [Vicinamibacterales bacterium]|nr:class I SAM-dependent methyltransferase [Vicinamibacterales bacterium]
MTVSPGHYAQKQLLSRSGLVRWSHGSRFSLARELVAPFAGRRLLDYGCGDGTFLTLVQHLFPEALGVDVDGDQITDCAMRFAGVPGATFLTTDRLAGPAHAGRYDVVVCMEVLEHCPDDVQPHVLDQIRDVTAAGGTVIVSVPIEIGLPLVAKQSARAMVALGGVREYATRERYSLSELTRLVAADADTVFPREEYIGSAGGGRTTRFTGHKGFNWRALEKTIAARLTIERRMFSPLPLFGSLLNSQVWFVCRKR